MTEFTRYAIYFLPAGPLAEAGASWLGWDIRTATPRAQNFDVAEITARPGKYGFHGTLRAPMRLAEGVSYCDLLHGAAQVAQDHRPFSMELSVAFLARFLALVPRAPSPALDALARDCVTRLDAFRAPLTEAELVRRRQSRLTPRQDANLTRWGYPHVLEDFRFHMTLTGPLQSDDRPGREKTARAVFGPLLREPVVVADLAIVGERMDGRFQLIERVPLGA